ncbi:hypothetical protein [Streptomyces sp. 8N706]|uniref:hypothetical protein n=1 Tax=Streptomyces sp. 8N706 TaxID=3457416 RepID=UPI003FD26FDD
MHEFDIGYLVYAFPPSTAPNGAPPEPGGSNIVISKVNGDISYVPNYPPETAIETYRRFYRPST